MKVGNQNKLSKIHKCILNTLYEYGPQNIEQLAEFVGKSSKYIQKYLLFLKEQGDIDCYFHEKTNDRYYILYDDLHNQVNQ